MRILCERVRMSVRVCMCVCTREHVYVQTYTSINNNIHKEEETRRTDVYKNIFTDKKEWQL